MHLPLSLRLFEVPRDYVPFLRFWPRSASVMPRPRFESIPDQGQAISTQGASAGMKPPETRPATIRNGLIRSGLCPVESVLVNRKTHKRCLQYRRRESVLASKFQKVAHDGVCLDGCALSQIAIHRGRQL